MFFFFFFKYRNLEVSQSPVDSNIIGDIIELLYVIVKIVTCYCICVFIIINLTTLGPVRDPCWVRLSVAI